MQHPEEGTIHAWIDGALSPAEGAALDAHVATCGDCAALVAEARGLVAASSRIVGHLDIVPGNVIPAIPAKRRFSLVRSPWPAAIAATLVLGIGLYSRSSDAPRAVSEVTSMQDIARAPLADSGALAPVTRPAVSQTPAPPPSIGPSARQRAEAPVPVAQRMAAGGTAAAVSSGSVGGIASGSGIAGGIAREGVVANATTASAPISGQTPAPTSVPTSARMSAPTSPDRAAARSAQPSAMARREAALDQSELAESDVVTAFVGCYEMSSSTETFPARFALVADTVPGTSGLLEVRYVDAGGRLSDRILDAGWSTESGRAVVKTIARGPILTLARTGETVAAQSPNGPRTGRVRNCSR